MASSEQAADELSVMSQRWRRQRSRAAVRLSDLVPSAEEIRGGGDEDSVMAWAHHLTRRRR